jgi:hypothetical protein
VFANISDVHQFHLGTFFYSIDIIDTVDSIRT